MKTETNMNQNLLSRLLLLAGLWDISRSDMSPSWCEAHWMSSSKLYKLYNQRVYTKLVDFATIIELRPRCCHKVAVQV